MSEYQYRVDTFDPYSPEVKSSVPTSDIEEAFTEKQIIEDSLHEESDEYCEVIVTKVGD